MLNSFEAVVPLNRNRDRDEQRKRKKRESLSKSRSYRLLFFTGAPRAALLGFLRGRTLLRSREERRSWPCHVFRMNLHDVPACSYVTFCACACVRTCTSTSMWAEIPCSGRCWTIFPCAPSRYETRHDYTLSARRGQGRIVLLNSSAPQPARWCNGLLPTTPPNAKTHPRFFISISFPFISFFTFSYLLRSLLVSLFRFVLFRFATCWWFGEELKLGGSLGTPRVIIVRMGVAEILESYSNDFCMV